MWERLPLRLLLLLALTLMMLALGAAAAAAMIAAEVVGVCCCGCCCDCCCCCWRGGGMARHAALEVALVVGVAFVLPTRVEREGLPTWGDLIMQGETECGVSMFCCDWWEKYVG